MEFEWDEKKRDQVNKKHDVDLLYAALIFVGPVIERPDERKDYGEERTIALGMIDGVPYTVVYTMRGSKTRLITAWRGGEDEREEYQNRFPG